MKPAPFDYHRPETLDEALALLHEHGDAAKVLAGGQSLVPAMSFRLAQPAVLVDFNRIPGLAYIEEDRAGGLRLGAMTRQRTAEGHDAVARRAPLLHRTLPHIAHPQIRNRGTLGGSLAHADPAAELPAVALAMEASFRLARQGGERTVAAADFFTSLFETALEPQEMLREILLPPPPPRTGWAFDEVSRRHGDYALVGVAARLSLDLDGRIAAASLAYLSVGEGPVAASAAQQALIGEAPGEDLFRAAAAIAAKNDLDPPSDLHATAEFRRHLAAVLTRRVLAAALVNARTGPDTRG